MAPVLLAVALAGCIGAGRDPPDALVPWRLSPVPEALLSQARHGIMPGEDLYFESHDGTTLHAALWRPEAPPEWKAPVVLVMSPYLGADAREDPLRPASLPLDRFNRWLVEHFVPRGYAVALADVRGTGDSGGCLGQSGWRQGLDGYVTVEHLAALPWSSGRVGMAGLSYLGESQQATAIHAPPHLVTIVPMASVDDGYKWWFHDGVPYWDPWLSGATVYMTSDGLQPPLGARGLAAYPERPWCHPELARAVLGDGTHEGIWEDLDLRPGVANIRAGVLYVHGLQDWNVKPDNIHDWFNRIEAPKQAWLGQWAHNHPWRNTHQPEWSRADWNGTLHRWFDHWLLGVDNGVMDLPRVQVQDNGGAWRAERDWPPRDARPFTLHLAPDGSLAPAPPAAEGSAGYVEQAELAAPRLAEAVREAASLPGWVPGARLRPPVPAPAPPWPLPDGLRFAGEPLAAPLRFAGTPEVRLTVVASEADTHVAVHLLAIAPDGTETILDRGYRSAQHRVDLARRDPLVPGQPAALTVVMYPQDTVVPAGHRLALWVGPWDDWAMPEGNGARVELLLGPGREAALHLPEVARDLARVGLDPPLLAPGPR